MTKELEKLMQNEELMTGLAEVETAEELMELFSANNLQLEEGLSPEEALRLVKASRMEDLQEDDLEMVGGGIALTVGIGAVACLVLGAGMICFLAGNAYQTYLNSKKKKKTKKASR